MDHLQTTMLGENTEMDTQRICRSEPYCLCVGQVNEWDECCCTGNAVGCRTDICEACEAPLVLIDFETGEKVAA